MGAQTNATKQFLMRIRNERPSTPHVIASYISSITKLSM